MWLPLNRQVILMARQWQSAIGRLIGCTFIFKLCCVTAQAAEHHFNMQNNSSGGSSLCIQGAIFRLNSMSVAVFIPFHLGRGNSSMSLQGINIYYNPHVDSPQQTEMARHITCFQKILKSWQWGIARVKENVLKQRSSVKRKPNSLGSTWNAPRSLSVQRCATLTQTRTLTVSNATTSDRAMLFLCLKLCWEAQSPDPSQPCELHRISVRLGMLLAAPGLSRQHLQWGSGGPSLSLCLLPGMIYFHLLQILHLMPFNKFCWWLPGNGFMPMPVAPQQWLKNVKIGILPLCLPLTHIALTKKRHLQEAALPCLANTWNVSWN